MINLNSTMNVNINKNKSTNILNVVVAWLLVTPALLVFLLIIAYPFCNSIFYSFTDKHLLYLEYKIINLENYKVIFSNPYVLNILKTTLIFVVGSTLLPLVLGFIWAIIMNQKFKGSEFLRGLTLVNWIIPGIAIGFLWQWIFNANYGILNGVLTNIGLLDENVLWLSDSRTALLTVIIARTWQMFPWYMSFILGGLQGVPNEQVEAARLDGATNFQTFKNVVLPSVLPIVSIVVIMGTIGNFQHFDLIKTMINSAPAGSATTFATEVYSLAFEQWNIGRAAALGVVWAVVLSGFSVVYLRRLKED